MPNVYMPTTVEGKAVSLAAGDSRLFVVVAVLAVALERANEALFNAAETLPPEETRLRQHLRERAAEGDSVLARNVVQVPM